MKNSFKALLCCIAALLAIFLIIHRRVIAAAVTGKPMPEPPEWHKKYIKCGLQEEKK